MNARPFDPIADAAGNYFTAWRAIALLTLLTGERWATEADTFDLVLAAALMRARAA